MRGTIDERACDLALYIIETDGTVRSAAKAFGVSKSTVHSDVARRLRRIDTALFDSCNAVLQRNKQERHVRGGNATREKYERLKSRG